MALAACHECGREISDLAAACPHCGAPMGGADAVAAPRRPWGCGTLVMILVALAVLAWGVGAIVSDSRPRRTAATADVVVPAHVQAAAIDKFRSSPVVRHAEWTDGDLVIAVHDNGKPWQPVANGACTWIRAQGAPAGFSVVVLEAAALGNKRWEQLARARCQ